MKRTHLFHIVAAALIVLLLLWQFGVFGKLDTGSDDYPTKAIRIVVPYPAGGGSDTFTRIIERAISDDELLPVPIVIQNLGGGSGTIGSREVKDADPDGYSLLMHHNALLGTYVDKVADFGPDDYEKICMTGSMTMVIIVRADSRFKDLTGLLEAAKADPKKITFGANQGSQAYFTAKQLESMMEGAEFAMVSAKGGADRYASLIGGHLDAGIFALSEYLDFVRDEGTAPENNIRALTVLSAERHEAIPQVSTSKEQGFGVYMENVYYWWAPKGTPQPIQDKLADVLKKAMANETVLSELERLRINPDYVVGPEVQERIDDTIQVMRASAVTATEVKIPDIPIYVIIITALLLLGVIIQTVMGKVPEEDLVEDDDDMETKNHSALAFICFGVVVLYVWLLHMKLLPWTLVSFLMIVLVGGLMCKWQPRRLIVIAEIALLVSLGTAYIFTEVLTGVILP